MLYVKLSKSALKPLSKENVRNIPLNKVNLFGDLLVEYGVTKIYRPFAQAFDDEYLPAVLKIEFKNKAAIGDFMKALSKIRGVESSERVPLMKTDILPNDPTVPPHLAQINAANAWNIFNGNSNITLAIVDNAVMWSHQDLVANTYTNVGEIAGNNIDDDLNGYVDDIHGWDVADWDNSTIPTNFGMDHGTHCAGIAGATTDNSIGIASIGWNIKIIPVKTTYDNANTSTISDGYGGIVYAANAKAKVISCSWGGSGFAMAEQNVINYAWNKGCIVIAAAGNANVSTQSYPGAYANVYCVSSVNNSDVKSSFSNYGNWVDIAAPGEGIYSTISAANNSTYGFKSGTSMATPLVAGLAAMMLSKAPAMTQTDVLNCISSTAVNIYTITGNSTYSTSSQLGAGRIEAFQAMTCASGFLTMAPIANFFAFPLNTCPNTSVLFTDSSIYAPTNWSWSFQNGTPATSTLSNPSVQWSNPGTYSVGLTVSNAFGNNTKTKLSYITVAGPIALPLAEGFESATFLPPNWTPNNIYNDNIYWVRQTGVGGFATSTACAMFDNYNVDAARENDEIRTPKYIFSNVANAHLRFDVAYARYNMYYTDTLEVKLSSNCGASWTSIYLKGGTALSTAPDLSANTFTPTNAEWRTDSVDISTLTAGQGNVMFSFINRGHYGQSIHLDNINLAFPTPTLNISAPPNACSNTSFSVANTNTAAASYTWNFSGGTPATSTASNPVVSYPTAGVYTVSLIGSNGTSTSVAASIVTIAASPNLSTNTPTICNNSIATLTAVGATSYTWAGFTSGSTISVSPVATTVYTVTGSNNTCFATRTATVFVNANPSLTVSSPSICSGLGTVIIPSGATSYTWTDGTTISTTPTLAVAPIVTTNFTLTGSDGNCSSETTLTVTVKATPTVMAQSATICAGATTTLYASGATSYVWNTGPTSASLTVSPASSTNYSVTGSTQGCSTVKVVSVTVQAYPSGTLTAAAAFVCAGINNTITANGAATYSWNTGSLNQSIVVNETLLGTYSYSVTLANGNCSNTASISYSVIVAPPLIVAPVALFCSGSTATLSASGPYSTITWSNGQTNSTVVSPFITTNYTVTGTNYLNSGCTTNTTLLLIVNPKPLTAFSFTNANCSDLCSAKANASSSNGTGPYTYSINGITCNTFPCANLCTGDYTVITTDAIGCQRQSTLTIAPPVNYVTLIATASNANCNTCTTGGGSVLASGGLAPYTYTWSPVPGNQSSLGGLLPGCYTVSVSDANKCTRQASICIIVENTTGLNSLAGKELLLIYPNPTQSQVSIEFKGMTFDYIIYNGLGQIITEKHNNIDKASVAVEQYSKGVYSIVVSVGAERMINKLVIQ